MATAGRRVRGRTAVAGVLAIAVTATVVVSWPHVQRYANALPPEQFRRELDPTLLQDYAPTLGIAHNAGNDFGTLTAALDAGADVIEVDVISVRGQLVAGRDQPWPWLADHLFRGPALQDVWESAASATVLKLDLKQSDRALLDDLVVFLAPRLAGRRVMISTRDRDALLFLHDQLPEVTLLFSIGFPEGVRQLQADPALVSAIGGISAFQGLVGQSLVTWAHDRDLLVIAWRVDDAPRLNELVRERVDGITTANLAILEVLSG